MLVFPAASLSQEPPAYVPDFFGGSAHGLTHGMAGGCSGQLFAFSGLDGPTRSTSNFVGIFQNASNYDMRFCLASDRYVRVRVPGGPGTVLAATNDVLWARHGPALGDAKLAWRTWDVLTGVMPVGSAVALDDAAGLAPPTSAPSGMMCEGVAVKGAAAAAAAATASNCSDLGGPWGRPGRSSGDDYKLAMRGAAAFTATSRHPSSWETANGTLDAGTGKMGIAFDNGKHNTGKCAVGAAGATYFHWSDGSTWARVPSGKPSLVLCQVKDRRGAMALAMAYGDNADDALASAAGAAAGTAGSIDATVAARLAWVGRTPRVAPALTGARGAHLYAYTRQQLLNKAVSVMRVNSLSPEGDITQHWSTPDRQPHRYMWLWDSCYHSMARSVLNDTLGWEFVQSMLSVQAPSGAVPIERSPLGAAGAEAGAVGVGPRIDTTQTQPPLLAWAIWENYEMARGSGPGAAGQAAGLARLRYAVPRLERYLEWDFANRADPTGRTPLLYWLKGTESGMDNSQRFDGYSYRRPLLAVDFSVFAAREAAFVARMHGEMGNTSAQVRWAALATNMSAAVHATLWDEAAEGGAGFYRDRHTSSDGGAFSDVSAVSGLLPLWLPDVPAERAARLVATLSDPRMFAAPVPLPSVALSTRAFSTDMWRGPMWLNTNWHVALALLSRNDTGCTAAARALLGATVDAVGAYYRKHGVLFEFYDSRNATDPTMLKRKGLTSGGVRDYHWTAALTFRMILKLDELQLEASDV